MPIKIVVKTPHLDIDCAKQGERFFKIMIMKIDKPFSNHDSLYMLGQYVSEITSISILMLLIF